MTECNPTTLEFEGHFSRQVLARFDGGAITTDAGGLLLREVDQRLNLLPRLAECFLDARNPLLVRHSVQEMVAQRVYGLALGYEDLNDHEQLRQDPVMKVLAGKAEVEEEALAGKSTLNRLELSDGTASRYKKITYWKDGIDRLLVEMFLEAPAEPPEQMVIDVDTTDVAIHGGQEGRFFHGYYDHYCYLPLYLFCGEHVLGVRLRPANHDAATGSLQGIFRAKSGRGLTGERSPPTPVVCCCARWTSGCICCRGWPSVSWMHAIRCWCATRCRRWCPSGCMDWRWATRI